MRKMMVCCVLTAGLVSAAHSGEVAKPAGARLWVPLTLTERTGVDRIAEPVTSGVPLPEGLVEDTGKLVLIGPDGQAVPTQFTVATRWYPGRSIKWVLLDFQAWVPANGAAVYHLSDVGENPAPRSPVAVKKTDDAVTFATGVLQLTVKRTGFNLFDKVMLSPAGDGAYTEPLLAEKGMEIELAHGGTGLPTLKKFSPANDPDVTLDVEMAGPMRAVVRLTGKHLSTDDQPGDNHLLDFVCRITAYAGSGRVKVDYSLECKQGDSISMGVPLDRFWFAAPLNLDANTRTWAVGLKDGQYMGPGCDPNLIPKWNDRDYEKPGPEVRQYHEPGLADCIVHSESSSRVVYRGDFWRKREPLYCRGKHEKKAATTVGWMDLSDAGKGMAASIRWFWQTWPRGIMVGGNNMYVMGQTHLAPKPDLMTRDNARRAHYYPGMSKTTEFLFQFHGPRDVKRIVSAHVGLQTPLRAWTPPEWYCEQTQVFGRLVSSDKKHFDDETWKLVQQYDANVAATKKEILRLRDIEYGDYDCYGMFNFGDTMNFIKQQRGDPCDRYVTWDNCYYDYPHALMLQWARTGDPDYFDMFEQAQHHLMDLDMVCYHPDSKTVGANRYCDGTMHIRQSGGIYVSGTFNHYKTQSHFERYYLTGYQRARDMGILSAEFSLSRNAMSFGQPRSLGHGPLGALAGWEATGERRFLERFTYFEKDYMNKVDGGARISKGRHWQGGIGFEGMREYYEHCGDPRALENLAVQVEACAQKGDYAASTLHAFAFLGAQLDKPLWTEKARDRIGRLGVVERTWGHGQSFGNSLRNAPYVWWYLTRDLPKKLNPPVLK